MVILSAIVCITLLSIAMVWNSDKDNNGYDGSDEDDESDDYDSSDEDDESDGYDDHDDYDGRDDYTARRAHEAQREEMLAQIRDHETHDLHHVVGNDI